MAQTKTEIQALLESIGMAGPRKRFGQNFMIDQNLIAKIVEAGQLEKNDLIIEVGPGTGTLTEDLLASGAEVVAVEIDRDLAKLLRERFANGKNFRLIEGDALAGKHELNAEVLGAIHEAKMSRQNAECRMQNENQASAFPPSPGTPGEGRGGGTSAFSVHHSSFPGCPHPNPPPEYQGREDNHRSGWVKLVANLPYNIASPLIIESLIAGVALLAFTVQREVAERLAAKADSAHYGPLSVMAQMLGDVELLRILPPQAFWPAPKVESALVRIIRHDRLGLAAADFSRFVHALFSSRRKMLRKALSQAGYHSLADGEIDLEKRVEVLAPDEIWNLWQKFSPKPLRLGG